MDDVFFAQIIDLVVLFDPCAGIKMGVLSDFVAQRAEPAHAIQPENAWIALMQGVAHAQLGEWGPAIAAFERAQALDPSGDIARQDLERARRREPPIVPGLRP